MPHSTQNTFKASLPLSSLFSTPFYRSLVVFLLLGFTSCVHIPPEEKAERSFRFKTDTLGFSNETVWSYDAQGNPIGAREDSKKTGKHYSRRCFVVSRAAVQFWKFARFEPQSPKLPPTELAQRIRKVARIDVWKEPLPFSKRIVFPGYSHLHEISSANPEVFQDHLGLGWPVYCRIANMPMILPPTRPGQADLFRQINIELNFNYPVIVWLVDFPKLKINHAVVIYKKEQTKGDRTTFLVYDPNDHQQPKRIFYDARRKTFSFQKTFYYQGGDLDLRPLYRSPIQ